MYVSRQVRQIGNCISTTTKHLTDYRFASIHHALPSRGSSNLLVSPLLVSPQRTDTVPLLLLSAQTDRLPRSYPSSNGDLTLGPGGPSTSRLEQPHKQERRHTLTQNLKAMGLWVLLIRCSTFTFLSDVGHITHTCTQHHCPQYINPKQKRKKNNLLPETKPYLLYLSTPPIPFLFHQA